MNSAQLHEQTAESLCTAMTGSRINKYEGNCSVQVSNKPTAQPGGVMGDRHLNN